MKILFIGKVKFSEEILKFLIKKNINISGIVTDNKKGINSDHSDLSYLGNKHNICTHITQNINSIKSEKWIKGQKPDLILCIGWSHLIRKNILSIPVHGIVGYHPTELPENRGRHPIIWSLVLGLNSTASTLFLMNQKADAGKILNQKKVIIKRNYNSKMLYNNLIKVAKLQILQVINNITINKVKFLKKKNTNSNIWRKRNSLDGRIDWRMSAKNIYNLIRALDDPYPGAHFVWKKNNFIVWKADLLYLRNNSNIEPGKVLNVSKNNNVTVKCGEGSIVLKNITPRIKLKKGDYL